MKKRVRNKQGGPGPHTKINLVKTIATRLSLVFLRVAHPEICESELRTMQVFVLFPMKTPEPTESLHLSDDSLRRRSGVLLSWR